MTTSKIKILLVDDHMLFRSGLRFLLETQKDFEIIGEAADGLEGIKLAESLYPDVVLLDLDMPIMGGREALPQLLSTQPNLAILILTVSEDTEDLSECMRIGARGYLLKNINSNFLLDSIRKAADGDNVLSPEMTSKLVTRLRISTEEDTENLHNTLTPREKEILIWLSKGVSNKEIARKLDLTESTIKVHVQNVLKKLNLHSRVQAAIYAIEYNLTSSV